MHFLSWWGDVLIISDAVGWLQLMYLIHFWCILSHCYFTHAPVSQLLFIGFIFMTQAIWCAIIHRYNSIPSIIVKKDSVPDWDDLLFIHSRNTNELQIIYLKDEFWVAGGYLFDVHTSLWASYHDWPIAGPVHQDGKVGLSADVQGLSNHHLDMAQQEWEGLTKSWSYNTNLTTFPTNFWPPFYIAIHSIEHSHTGK